LLSGGLVFAQSPSGTSSDEPESTILQDVVVTARRIEESSQRVPIAISTYTPRQLMEANIHDSQSLAANVPGLQQFTKLAGDGGRQDLAKIRGVSGIATYFADAPAMNYQWTLYGPFFDIESFQVLKGPQGTLFGQASNAGAEIVEPTKPGNTLGGYAQVQVGNYNQKTFEGAVDLPIVADRVSLRLSGKSFFREGYVKDIFSDHRVGEENYGIARAYLVVKPTETFENDTIFQYQEVEELGNPIRTVGDFNMFPSFGFAPFQAALNGMTPDEFNTVRDQVLADQLRLGPYKSQGTALGCPATELSPATLPTVPGPDLANVIPSGCHPNGGKDRDYTFVNRTTWSFADDFSLKLILGHSQGVMKQGAYDPPLTRLILIDSNAKELTDYDWPKTYSEELQLYGKAFDDKLDFVVGAFGFQKYGPTNFGEHTRPTYAPYFINLDDVVTKNRDDTRSYAGYVQGDYHFSSGLSLTAGVRYERNSAIKESFVLDPITFEVVSSTGGRGTPNGEGDWNSTSYTLGLQYQLNPNTMFYVTNAKGASNGELQNVPGHEKVEPDHLNNLEAGVKARFSMGDNWAARADLSGYYGWFTDVKVPTLLVLQIPGTTGSTFVLATANAAKAHINGFDGSFDVAYRDLFDLRLLVGYSKAHYTEFPTADPATGEIVDISNTPFTQNPEWKIGISPTFHLPFDRQRVGDISLNLYYTYVSQYWAAIGKPITPTDPNDPNTGAICRIRRTAAAGYGPLSADGGWAYKDCVPQLDNLNVTLGWDNVMGKRGVRASLSVTNVTGDETPIGIDSAYDGLGVTAYDAHPPRFVYGSLSYSF